MAKGGAQWQDRLNALGTALSGYGSALTGNPMFLQSSLAMQQMQQQRREQEQQQRQSQAGNIALRSLIGGMQAPGTPATKAYEVNGRTIGQNREASGGMNPATQLGLLSKFAPGAVQSVVASQVMQQLFPQGFTGTLGEGQVAYQNGRPVATGMPKQIDTSSDLYKDALRIAGGNPEKAAELINKWRSPASTQITMSGDRAATKVDSDRYNRTAGTLDTLAQMEPVLGRMQQAMDEGAQTGFGQDWFLKFKQGIEEVTGEPLSGTSEQEVFKSLGSYLVPKMRLPGSGSSSDLDVKIFTEAIPKLSKTEAGNRILMDTYRRMREYYENVAEIQQDLLRQYDYIPIKEERKRINALGPMFDAGMRTALKGKAPTAAPDQPPSIEVLVNKYDPPRR